MALPDPFGLRARTVEAMLLPLKVAGWAERQALALLRARLDAVAGGPPQLGAPAKAPVPDGLEAKLGRLLSRALEQGTEDGRADLYHRLLDQLVPDEARILGALSDGSAAALIHVRRRTPSGTPGKVMIENASTVGRLAHVALPEQTPRYVTHLRSLGLVEPGPEDEALEDDYQILAAESDVLAAIKAGARGPLPAHVVKATLRLSPLGRSLWDAATGEQR